MVHKTRHIHIYIYIKTLKNHLVMSVLVHRFITTQLVSPDVLAQQFVYLPVKLRA